MIKQTPLRYFIILFISFQVNQLIGQGNTPKYSNEFLAIGVNARAIGMSSAFTAVADDVTAAYWNPARLINLKSKYEVGLMHNQYFSGIANYDYVGFATKVDSVSTLAISVIRLGVDDIPDTRFLYDANGRIDYDKIRFFSAADYAFLISYAHTMDVFGGIGIGANAKIIYRHVGNFASAWGYGIDIGFTKKIKHFHLGLMLKDITGTYNTWSHNSSLLADVYQATKNTIPENSIEITLPRAILGISYVYQFKSFGVLVALDLVGTFDGTRNTIISADPVSIDPQLGIELDYLSKFFIRAGVGQLQTISNFDQSKTTTFQPNFGLGVSIQKFNIDYAISSKVSQTKTPYSHVISIKISFNEKK